MNDFKIGVDKVVKDAFTKGYLCAVAQIIQQHGEDRIAEDVLRCNYLTIEQMHEIGVDEYDIEILSPIVKEIQRKSAFQQYVADPIVNIEKIK